MCEIEFIPEPDIYSCDACGAVMYDYEIIQCVCGALVHADCIKDGECNNCKRVAAAA